MELDLHVTNNCNLLCRHCIYESNEKIMPDISIHTVKEIIPSIIALGIDEVHLTGGEPLLHPHIFELIDIINDAGLAVRFQTNGYAVDEDIAKKLLNHNVKSVLVSIDGTEFIHNRFRGNPNSYRFAVNAIEIFIKLGIQVRVNSVLHKNNVSCIKPLLELSRSLNVEQHSFFYLSPGGRGGNIQNWILSLDEWNAAVKKIRETSKALEIENKVKYQHLIADLQSGYNECRLFERDNCLIMSNGDVYPCVFFVNSEFSLGNINNENLYEIWSNDEKWESYKTKRVKKCNNPKCKGGCIGLTYLLNGNISDCDPRCEVKKGLIPGCIRSYSKVVD